VRNEDDGFSNDAAIAQEEVEGIAELLAEESKILGVTIQLNENGLSRRDSIWKITGGSQLQKCPPEWIAEIVYSSNQLGALEVRLYTVVAARLGEDTLKRIATVVQRHGLQLYDKRETTSGLPELKELFAMVDPDLANPGPHPTSSPRSTTAFGAKQFLAIGWEVEMTSLLGPVLVRLIGAMESAVLVP
jgi:hypothetical protein